MTLLVTGASGYLGVELMNQAPEAHGTYLTTPVPGSWRLDVREAGAVEQAINGYDAVIHTAYVQAEEDTIARGSANVAAACALHGARLVHMSTDVVFSGTAGRPYTEADEPDPVIPYGRAKLAAEREVMARCPGAVMVRTSLIYGGPQRPPGRQEQVALNPDTEFFTDELRSVVAVDDLAKVALELVSRPDVTGPLHAGGADGVSRFEFAQLVVASRGGDPTAVRSTTIAATGMTRPADCRLDSSRCAQLLGWSPRGVRGVLTA